MSKKMKYMAEDEREIAQFGVFKPGDVVDYDEKLHKTGLFNVIKKKEGDK
jgi:hypothetical protein